MKILNQEKEQKDNTIIFVFVNIYIITRILWRYNHWIKLKVMVYLTNLSFEPTKTCPVPQKTHFPSSFILFQALKFLTVASFSDQNSSFPHSHLCRTQPPRPSTYTLQAKFNPSSDSVAFTSVFHLNFYVVP